MASSLKAVAAFLTLAAITVAGVAAAVVLLTATAVAAAFTKVTTR